MSALNLEAVPAVLLVSHFVVFLLGFIAYRVLEAWQLSGERIRTKQRQGEIAAIGANADGSRRLVARVRRTFPSDLENAGRVWSEETVLDCELRDLMRELVANGEPFDCPGIDCMIPYQVGLNEGDSIVVELSAANPLGLAAPITKIQAIRRS